MLRLNGPAPRALPRPDLIPIPGGAVEAVVASDGPAFLALHGGMGGWDQSWLLAAALLGDDLTAHRVVAVSRPGYLGTPLALGPSPDAAADQLAAVLDALGIDRTVVAAVSAGGPTALTFAARHPDRVRALIMVSTATGTLEITPHIAERLNQFRRLAAIPGVTAAIGAVMRLTWAKAAARSIADPVQLAATLADPEAGPLFRALLESTSRRIAERLSGTLNDTALLQDLTLPLDAVRAPVLSLHGDADRIVPFSHSDRLVAAIAGTERLVLPDGGHTALFTHRAMIRDRVTAFLARQAG
jgi:pimeloyl-ACP methyl ester carboxylesterase